MHSLSMCFFLAGILPALAVKISAESDQSARPVEAASGLLMEDFVDTVESPAKHSHAWVIKLGQELDEVSLKDVRLTVLYGPGCGRPLSLWRQVVASSVIAGAAGLNAGNGTSLSTVVGAVSSALLSPSSRHCAFTGRRLKLIGDGWYVLAFMCQHDGGIANPTARLLVRLPGGHSGGQRILATPWRPLARGDPMLVSAQK